MEKKTNNPAITKSYAKKMETISPFELKNKLIDMADESIKKIAHTMLNAGRGNPNWIATEPREAFFLLGQFGLCECRHAFSLEEGIAGIPQKAGIAARFEAFLKENEKAPGANLLKEGYNYMLMEHAADPDTLIHEWAESVIGDQYPVPDRILHFTELSCRITWHKRCVTAVRRKGLLIFSPPKEVRQPCVICSILCKRISC